MVTSNDAPVPASVLGAIGLIANEWSYVEWEISQAFFLGLKSSALEYHFLVRDELQSFSVCRALREMAAADLRMHDRYKEPNGKKFKAEGRLLNQLMADIDTHRTRRNNVVHALWAGLDGQDELAIPVKASLEIRPYSAKELLLIAAEFGALNGRIHSFFLSPDETPLSWFRR